MVICLICWISYSIRLFLKKIYYRKEYLIKMKNCHFFAWKILTESAAINIIPLRLNCKKELLFNVKGHNMKNQSHLPVNNDQLMNIIIEIFSEILVNLEKSKNNEDKYYDSADVKRLLNISDSTLFRNRKSQKIPYVKIGRKIFYLKSFFTTALRKWGYFF